MKNVRAMCRMTVTTITFAAQRWMLRMKRPVGDDEMNVLDRVVRRLGIRLVVEHQQHAGNQRDQERRRGGDSQAHRRGPAEAPAVRPHRVQMQEHVAEHEQRPGPVGDRRPAGEPELACQIRGGADNRFSANVRRADLGGEDSFMRSTLVPAGTVASSSTTYSLPLPVIFRHGKAVGAGPLVTPPSGANRDPWQGHSKPSGESLTMQPKCVHTREMAYTPSVLNPLEIVPPARCRRGSQRELGAPHMASNRLLKSCATPPASTRCSQLLHPLRLHLELCRLLLGPPALAHVATDGHGAEGCAIRSANGRKRDHHGDNLA